MRHKWHAHANLQRLYQERIGDSMTQKEFGRKLGISQSMVAQILGGERTLPIDLAPKFAAALRCSIYDICPDMGDYIKEELLPVLGKGLRRTVVVLAVLVFQPSDAIAGISHSVFFSDCGYFAKSLNLLHIASSWLSAALRRLLPRHNTLQMFRMA